MNNKLPHPFNNNIETALRVVCILTTIYPRSLTVEHINYLDYLSIHSFDSTIKIPSLHPDVPERKGELFVRREIIQAGLALLCEKGLATKMFTKRGIEYLATEYSRPFINNLESPYTLKLLKRIKTISNKYSEVEDVLDREMWEFMKNNDLKVTFFINE